MNGISNICLPGPRFGFGKSSETLTRVWQGKAEYLKPNIRIFDVDYPIRHPSSWWPIRFLIFSHKLTFSRSHWSVQTKNTTARDITTYYNDENRFFSIDDFTPKFIEIGGNPSFCINASASPIHPMFEYLRTNHGFDSTNLWRCTVWQIQDSTSNIRIFGFDRVRIPFTVVAFRLCRMQS